MKFYSFPVKIEKHVSAEVWVLNRCSLSPPKPDAFQHIWSTFQRNIQKYSIFLSYHRRKIWGRKWTISNAENRTGNFTLQASVLFLIRLQNMKQIPETWYFCFWAISYFYVFSKWHIWESFVKSPTFSVDFMVYRIFIFHFCLIFGHKMHNFSILCDNINHYRYFSSLKKEIFSNLVIFLIFFILKCNLMYRLTDHSNDFMFLYLKIWTLIISFKLYFRTDVVENNIKNAINKSSHYNTPYYCIDN